MKLRHGLPVALLAFASLLGLGFYLTDRVRSAAEVEQQVTSLAAFNGDRLAAEVEDEIIAGDSAAAERTLVRLSAMPHLRQAMVLDDRLRVQLASRFNRKGADFASLPGMPPAEHFAAAGLLRDADAAARHAKEAERGGFRFFAPEMNAQALDRFALENDLRHALAAGQLFLAYQPQVEVAGGRVVGVEALVRWQHPEKGLISPARFIPVAEESGLILSLGDWVLKEATRQTARWQEQGLDLRVAVNLSALQFRQSQLPTQVKAALEEAGLAAHRLELEITESTLMDNTEQAISHLWELSDMGVQLAIDDFGTGYSSLAYLKRFPLQRLKIDQAFVRDLSTDANDAAIVTAIVTAIVGLARSLGMQVTAEGVETAEQLAYLADLSCDEYQGYYCSRPIPAGDIPEVVARQANLLEV